MRQMANTKMIGVAVVILILVSLLGYVVFKHTEKVEESNKSVKSLTIEGNTTGVPTIANNGNNGTLIFTFKENIPMTIYGMNIELLGLADGEDIALIMVNGEPYQMKYNVEKEIKSRIIKVIDPDYSSLTVKISVRYS